MRLVKRFLGWKQAFTAAILGAAFVALGSGEADRALLSIPRIVEDHIVFSFDSATNQVLTVQGVSSVSGDWQNVTNHLGTGAQLEFFDTPSGRIAFLSGENGSDRSRT
jgi:hypothetical protein